MIKYIHLRRDDKLKATIAYKTVGFNVLYASCIVSDDEKQASYKKSRMKTKEILNSKPINIKWREYNGKKNKNSSCYFSSFGIDRKGIMIVSKFKETVSLIRMSNEENKY